MKEVQNTIIVLKRANITPNMFLEEIAYLDKGVSPDEPLQDGTYCVYYRVGVDTCNTGIQYVTDWTCLGLDEAGLTKLFREFTNK